MRKGREVSLLGTVAAVLIVFCASQTSAQTCPDFYRFVDFGLQGNDDAIYRGGPTFRAEGFDGQPLLLTDRTDCLDVQDIAKDGHGNPIPLVARITYDSDQAGIDLADLSVGVTDDIQAMAEENARAHRARLDRSETEVTRGPNFLCARSETPPEVSCQLQSPYPGETVLVVYCTASECTMPVLAMNERLSVSAIWESPAFVLSDPGAAGADASGKVQRIKDFLDPISSGL